MQCLPDNLRDRVYYQPTNEGIEKRIRERMEEIKKLRAPAAASKASRPRKESWRCSPRHPTKQQNVYGLRPPAS